MRRCDLAIGTTLCYFGPMLRDRFRRALAPVLALSLALGVMLHNIGSPALGMNPAMVTAGSDMPMPGNCDGCGDDQARMLAACAVHCGVVLALPATIALLDFVAVDILSPAAGRQATGYVGPPDPY